MRKVLLITALAGALLSLAAAAAADLTHPLYVKGKEQYKQQKYGQALELLIAYKKADADFLKNNLEVAKKIDDAISYCLNKLQSEVSSSAITKTNITAVGTPGPPPKFTGSWGGTAIIFKEGALSQKQLAPGKTE